MRQVIHNIVLLAALLLAGSAAVAQTLNVVPSQVDIVVPAGFNHLPFSVPVTRAPGNTAALTVTSDAAWVSGAVGAGESVLKLTFATSALTNRTYTATVTVTDGSTTDTLFVRSTISVLNVTVLRDDPTRSRTYGVHQDGINDGALVVFDPIAATPLGAITLGHKPADFAISRDGTELIAINSAGRSLSVVDLATLSVKDTIGLATYVDWGPAETSAHVAYGPTGILYYTDGAWAPNLYVLDRATRTVKQIETFGGSGIGGVAVSPDRTRLYCWSQYGWSAGVLSSALARYAIAADGTLTSQQVTAAVYTSTFQRDPIGAPVLLSDDGTKLFVKPYQLSPGDLNFVLRTFPGPLYSISSGGEIASTTTAIYEVSSGNKVFDLPVTATAQAITSDYARLVYFDSAAHALKTIDLVQAVGLTILGRELTPAPGAIVLPPPALRWSPVPGIDRYRVYLGESSTAVGAAGTSSPEYRGEVAATTFTLTPPLLPGHTYYWRIDPVSSAEVSKGQVYSFSVTTIGVDQSAVEATTVQGHANYAAPLQLTSATAGKAWTATASASWIKLGTASGTTPGTLGLTLDATALEAGSHTGNVTISASDGSFTVPVRLQVDPLALTVMRADPASALVYAISEVTDSYGNGGRAYLLELDAQARSIRRVVRVGSSVTDIAIHRPDNRIYVTNWRGGSLLALGLTTLQLERTYGFNPVPSSTYGGDVYRIAAGGAGRLLVEEQDQWIDISIFNTTTGTSPATAFVREGGGLFAPGGRYYYHGENNSSGAEILKYDTAADQFTEVAAKRPGDNGSYYGSRTVVISDNGQRIFWAGSIYDANLAMVWSPGDIIYSATADGAYAFSETKVYDVAGQRAILSMPVTTKVSAYSAVASALVVQNGQRVRFYPFSPTGDLPAPVLAAEALSATTVRLTWSDESLESGFTVQRRLVGEAAWIDAGTFPANTTSAVIGSLLSSTAHEFRIKADALATSSAWSNIATATTLASPPTITTHPSSYVVNTGTPVTFTVVAGGGTPVSYQWRKGGQNLAGATASSYTIASAQTGDAGSYDVVVTNSVGSVTSNSATLTIQVPPVITQQPVSLNVAPGGTATFTIVATGTPTLSYRWQRQAAGTIGFVNVVNTLFPLSPPTYSGASSVTLTISAVSTALNGDQFRCVVTNGASPEATSNLVTLTVSAAPLITSAASTTFTAGLPGSFIVRATGAPAPVFAATGLPAWAALDPNTGVLSGTPPSTAGSPASVVITASNGVAPNATQTFALNVQAGTGVPVITTHPVGQSVGVGASVTFSVIATGAAPLTYEWRKNGATLAGATGMIFAIAAASTEDAGKYDVIVRNGVGAATSRAAFLSVVPAGVVATHAVVGGGYFPGSIISVTNTLNFPGTAESLGWQVLIPDGWSFVSAAGGQGDVKPVVGTTGVLEWAWTGPVTGPVSFTYTLNVPSNDSGPKDVAALVTIRLGGWPVQVLALPDPLSLPRATTHSADSDSDGRINVFELTRVIELYNTRNGSARTGCYRVQEGSEDGFSPDAARTSTTAAALLRYHSADTAMGAPRDGRIDLSELTRVIELYNYRVGTSRTGQYHVQTGTEDGFAPGP